MAFSPSPTPTPTGLHLTPDALTVAGAAAGGSAHRAAVHVLSNDVDYGGGQLLLVAVSQPAHGTATIVNNAVIIDITKGWGKSVLTYRVASTSGTYGSSTVTITVLPAPHIVHTKLIQNHQTRGIGTILTVHFSHPIQNRAAAQARFSLLSTKSFGSGSWAWRDSATVQFRPRNYWPGHATITFRAKLADVVLGTAADGRPYMGLNTVASFSTARAVIVKINGITDRMSVTIDGKVARTMGVSLGKPGFTTRSGVKVVAEKYLKRQMTAQGIGITNPNDQFDVIAPYAVRITTSGEFIHGAPWALGRIGRWNGSHGCTNLTPWDAQWFYNLAMPGDVVLTSGTNRTMEYWNGEGGPWNIPWKQWVAMSAGPVVTWEHM
jgi:lipoprotein-anchoring transpeptidase ErfK/SrfK